MEIAILDRQENLVINRKIVTSIVRNVIALEQQCCDEVAVHFVDTPEICRLHIQFFNDPAPTDCISFPIDGEDDDYRVLGEVFVCPETAIVYSVEHGVDVYEELTLYIIHGLLHLLGYDDISNKDRIAMRVAEQRHLANVKSKGHILTGTKEQLVEA
ncbi:MAG: rRNA maturation RNase YbeY [Waddliaceae bacterium]|jgi:probable rRNA maturation factor|nr:rRNA maturation RNase YbeY [Waddliaceae bacterium]MBT3579044.1 rRNA maturation RNase YbeY [Waddliaceae bacterium]MBT4444477.1 rRNA maturation RNase YbeY [Waddliaceae bacterium]MBT6929066.1 rRNA maturation RNase YbeY [Waddliaceae bacterium]MBT7264726.1 rRNA maturation RNase YbeY [Waddliaceae bacterium]